MDHVTTGGGGLLDGLQMRSVLTAGRLSGEPGRTRRPRRAARASASADSARTSAPRCATSPAASLEPATCRSPRRPTPRARLAGLDGPDDDARPRRATAVLRAPHRAGRYVAYLPGPPARDGAGGGCGWSAATSRRTPTQVARRHRAAVAGEPGARVMLVGRGQGGVRPPSSPPTAPAPAFVRRPGGHRRRARRAGAAAARRRPRCSRSRTAPTRSPCSARWSTPAPPTGSPWSSTAAGRPGRGVYVAGARAADAADHPDAPRRARPAPRAGLPRLTWGEVRLDVRCRARTRRAG